MSSFNLIISPIRVHRDEDTDEDKTEPFVNLNDSIASNSSNSSSSNSGDESPQPSSSAAGIRDEIRNKAANTVKINMHFKSLKPIELSVLDFKCRAQHYYNNPTDEYTFLNDSFFPFLGMVMVSNLVYWLQQLGHGFESTSWFASWGYQRIFLEALQQALSRLPYPRIYNCANQIDWIQDLHEQSSNIYLMPYPWAERPQLSPFTPNTYKPISEHYCLHHRNRELQGFIIGAQDGTEGRSDGCWFSKYEWWLNLPQRCLEFVQERLPDFQFHLDELTLHGSATDPDTKFNPTHRGFWSVSYRYLYLSAVDDLYSFNDKVPEPSVVHSGLCFSSLDLTALVQPYVSTGQSPVPTEHLQPGVYPSLTPFLFNPGYYLHRPVSNPSDPLNTYNLMPADLSETLTSLKEEVKELKDTFRTSSEYGLNDRVHYLETWFDMQAQSWSDVTRTQHLTNEEVKVDYAKLRDKLEVSVQRINTLEQALKEEKDKNKEHCINSAAPVNAPAIHPK